MPVKVPYNILLSYPKETLFLIEQFPNSIYVKVSANNDENFTYCPFINLNNETYSKDKLNILLEGKADEYLNRNNYLILTEEDINNFINIFQHFHNLFKNNTQYTLH